MLFSKTKTKAPFCHFLALFLCLAAFPLRAEGAGTFQMLWGRLSEHPRLENPRLPFGVEIEGTFPAPDLYERQVEHAAAVTRQSLEALRLEPRESTSYLDHHFRDSQHEGHWTVGPEDLGFLSAFFRRGPVEISTPIFERYESLGYLESVLKLLRSRGFRSYPLRGGMHVHVGLPAPDSRHAFLVAALYTALIAEIESEWRVVLGVSPWRKLVSLREFELEPWDRATTAPLFMEALVDFVRTSEQGIQSFPEHPFYFPSLYSRKLPPVRLLKLGSMGTVETTIWNSTLDSRSVRRAVEFSRTLLAAIYRQDEKLHSLLLDSEISGKKVRLRNLYRVLGLGKVPFNPLSRCISYLLQFGS